MHSGRTAEFGKLYGHLIGQKRLKYIVPLHAASALKQGGHAIPPRSDFLTMKMKNYRVITAAIFYSISIILAEVTLGNPEFPITLWIFDNIPAYKWSVPVHTFGFLWLIVWNKILSQKHLIFPTVIATLLFLFGETANWFIFHFFKYEETQFGPASSSFWLIIGLYFILCLTTCIILRSYDSSFIKKGEK